MTATTPRPAPSAAGLQALFGSPPPALTVRLARRRRGWPRQVLGPAQVLVASALLPLLLVAYADQVGGWAALTWGGRLALLPVAAPAALTLASYAPRRRAGVGSSPCATAAGLTVVFAGIALGGAPLQPATVVLAAGLASYGLRQRWRGASACGPRGRY